MHAFPFRFHRAHRLRPKPGVEENSVSQLRVDGPAGSQVVLLPYSPGLGYFIVPIAGAVRAIASEDFRAEPLSVPLSLWVRLRLALLFKRKKFLEFKEFLVFCYGVKPQRKRFTTFNQHLFRNGVALDGGLATSHPELLRGWAPVAGANRVAPATSMAPAAAVAAHVYYQDTWADIGEVLKRINIPFDLIVTTPPGRDRFVAAIKRDFPRAEVIVMENRGRDIGPFLRLLEAGRFDRYRYVCKIHGKKSNDAGRMPYMGSLWRRRLLFDLLAGPGVYEAIVDAFEQDATIGMIGPRAFRLPNATVPLEPAWGKNRLQVLELAERMGVPPERFQLDFYGGSMFWFRPEALAPLRELRLAREMPEEQGRIDGGIEHAVERIFSTAAVVAGYRLADSDGRAVLQSEPAADRETAR